MTFASMIRELVTGAAEGKVAIEFSHGLTDGLKQLQTKLGGLSGAEKLAALAFCAEIGAASEMTRIPHDQIIAGNLELARERGNRWAMIAGRFNLSDAEPMHCSNGAGQTPAGATRGIAPKLRSLMRANSSGLPLRAGMTEHRTQRWESLSAAAGVFSGHGEPDKHSASAGSTS